MAHTMVWKLLYSEYDRYGSIHMLTKVSEESISHRYFCQRLYLTPPFFYYIVWWNYPLSIPLTNVKWHSDPWPTVTSQPIRLSTNFMTLIPSLTFTDYEWFPWSICNGCGMPAGNAYHSGHLVPSPFLGGLHVLWLLRPVSPTLHRLNDLPKLTFTEFRGFHGAIATGVACQQGALTLPDTWFRPLFWDLLMLQLLRPNSSNLPCLNSTFHLEYPLVLSRFCR